MLGWLKTVEIVEAYGTDHCWTSFQMISSALSAASIRRIRSRKALNNSYPASSSQTSVSAENCRLDLATMMPPSVAVAARKSLRECKVAISAGGRKSSSIYAQTCERPVKLIFTKQL